MYTEIGEISKQTVGELLSILPNLKWEIHVSDETDHHAANGTQVCRSVQGLADLWPLETWVQLTFIRLPPHGKLHRHTDWGYGWMLPLETNDDVVSVSYRDGIRRDQHLEVGKVYHCDRTLSHESFNDGDTNRTHLVVVTEEANRG